MGEYIDMFANELSKLKSFRGESDIAKEIAGRMHRYWKNVPDKHVDSFSAVGVDSSLQSVALSTGYTLIVVRACLASSAKKRDLKVYITTGEVTELGNRLMENMENSLMSENIEEVSFVDGSLYGRASHVPLQFHNDGFENFILEYYSNYNHLIENARKKNSKLIGISKSSGTTFLRDMVVMELYMEELEINGLDGEDDLKSLPYLALDRKNAALKTARKKLKDNGLEKAYRYIEELTKKRPDASILTMFEPGMSAPVLLGSSARARRMYKSISSDENYIKDIFYGTDLDDTEVNTVKEYLNNYAFVSFYISFAPGFLLRVDMPAFVAGIERRMQEVYWPEPIKEDISNIVGIIRREHGDNYVHNVHLYAADLEARLTHGDFMKMYYPLIERELEANASVGDYRYIWRGE